MDRVLPAKRSEMMSKVRGTNTGPELIVRRIISSLGYHYRLHRRDLPGKPDLVFPGRKKVIFIHGCFWHRHECSAGRQLPKTRPEFWNQKLARNVERDREVQEQLRKMGWNVLIIWTCQLKQKDGLVTTIKGFLDQIPE